MLSVGPRSLSGFSAIALFISESLFDLDSGYPDKVFFVSGN